MATSKKKDRIQNLMQLRNTLIGGVPMARPADDEKLITYHEDEHMLIVAHVNKMLAEEGIFILTDLGVDS